MGACTLFGFVVFLLLVKAPLAEQPVHVPLPPWLPHVRYTVPRTAHHTGLYDLGLVKLRRFGYVTITAQVPLDIPLSFGLMSMLEKRAAHGAMRRLSVEESHTISEA